MYRVQETRKLPGDFAAFVTEIAAGIDGLYGAEAARNYRESAAEVIQASLHNGAAHALVAKEGGNAAGILMSFERHAVGYISFVHVLQSHAGRGVEDRLVRECVWTFRAGGVEGIVSECVPLCRLDVDSTYQSMGFERVARALLAAELDTSLLSAVEDRTTPITKGQYGEAAAVIADAYTDHPGRRLHVEVRREETALDFVERVAAGEHGPVQPDYLRAMIKDGQMIGVIFGCQVAPSHGFVLQVAVRRVFQRQGAGAALIADSARAFRRAGMKQLALGVTLSSPALRLYERLGFKVMRPVDAYAWWRP